ncbi:MAG: SPASM domain-containing protein [Bacteroidia bacterium]|nr:SPASM domain-containing protein [Bacteroidia bacterium]
MERHTPINKGNYEMDTEQRLQAFERLRGLGWEEEYADYRRKWSEYPASLYVSDYPLLLDLELASVCNLRCPMCYTITPEFRKKVNAKLMDWELYTKLIDETAGKISALRLSLRGESFLHKRFIDCIKYAKDKGIKEVSSLTSGNKFSPEFTPGVIDAGIDWITVSVDGVGDTYNRIRKPITFNEILESLKFIKKYKEERGLKKPVIKVQGIWPAIRENPQLYYDTFAPYSDLIAFNPLIDFLHREENPPYINNFTCPQHYQRLVVGADGLVMMCSNDEENTEVIGDANKHTIYEIWHGEKLSRMRSLHAKNEGFKEIPVCKKCYLPRVIDETETAKVSGRTFTIKNYLNGSQIIGKNGIS